MKTKRVRWVGPGVLFILVVDQYKAVGPGTIVEIDFDRAQTLLESGSASLDLRENVTELSVMEPEEFGEADPKELEKVSARYNEIHAAILKDIGYFRAARARFAAEYRLAEGEVRA